ncbi:hypothetical protein [Pseudoscardovia suis]|uniref:Uncharacterized protein n=1 Tax=Pseudoscardovia suis TaxID=987063 RepID=A0A261EX31_9BIFI|nr:hypothetical protein [Pseudoscardovia suis]OZG51429.1 hypothetical protein PSSU_1052 [Pseudoscardovia suis]PJJ68688.1 hypothetical protein CLV65_0590 [Pseudoscardovia suis]
MKAQGVVSANVAAVASVVLAVANSINSTISTNSITGIIGEIISDAIVVLRNILVVLGRIINSPSSLVD